MSGKRSRTKGHSYEREIANRFKAVYPDARRGLQYRDGAECPDVIDVPFHVECKRHKRVSIQAAYAQAVRDSLAGEGLQPVVVSRDDRGTDLATISLDYFLWLADRLEPQE